jgi:hypothetical protein
MHSELHAYEVALASFSPETVEAAISRWVTLMPRMPSPDELRYFASQLDQDDVERIRVRHPKWSRGRARRFVREVKGKPPVVRRPCSWTAAVRRRRSSRRRAVRRVRSGSRGSPGRGTGDDPDDLADYSRQTARNERYASSRSRFASHTRQHARPCSSSPTEHGWTLEGDQ